MRILNKYKFIIIMNCWLCALGYFTGAELFYIFAVIKTFYASLNEKYLKQENALVQNIIELINKVLSIIVFSTIYILTIFPIWPFKKKKYLEGTSNKIEKKYTQEDLIRPW